METPQQALKRKRIEAGLTQVELAGRAGIQSSHLSAMENGGAIGMLSAERLATVFKVPRSTFGWPSPEERL